MYIVIELQTIENQTSTLTYSYSDRNQAESKFHEILSYAAVSNVEFHAVSILDPLGTVVKNEYYTHPIPPNVEETASQE